MTIANIQAAEPAGARADVAGTSGNEVILDTRFGTIAFDRERTIHFASGLLGFGDRQNFALAELPQERLAEFRLLQSLDDQNLGFIVLPLDPASGPIAAGDLEDASSALEIRRVDAVFLLMVTVRNEGEKGISLTCNLRAPLIIDSRRRIGRQIVLGNSDYAIREPVVLAA